MSHFEKRVQLNKIIESQLPEFLVTDFPKAVEFFKQYYISQENQGSNDDLINNLDVYLKLDNLVPEVVIGSTSLASNIDSTVGIITVTSTKGYPDDYGLLKIDDEIITYTGKTSTTFTGCIRGFCGITGYNVGIASFFNDVNKESVVFSTSSSATHTQGTKITNLSVLFLQEFYKKLKKTFTPGLEEQNFVSDLNAGLFIKHARNFYQSKGIAESIRILFKVLYGVKAEVLDLERNLIKPSSAEFIRREVVVAERISGDVFELEGQAIYKSVNGITVSNTSASVSEVEIFTRDGKEYYKLGLFVGFTDKDAIQGTFTIPGYSKTLEEVAVGSDIITVDSTIGFPEFGKIISGSNIISYTSKSTNQFYGCSGVIAPILINSEIGANEYVFGYGNADKKREVKLRITGVLSEFVALEDISLVEEGESILIGSIGEIIENPNINKTYKEVFANSWIYNTSARYKVKSIVGSTFTLLSEIDKSSLKVGDVIDILVGSSETIVSSNATVSSITATSKQIVLNNISGFIANPLVEYSIRKKIDKVTSSNVALLLGNNKYTASIQNVYTTDDSKDGYVTSLSLPEYVINDELIESTLSDGTSTNLGSYDSFFQSYGSIKFSSNVKFIDGDKIVYTANNPLQGLSSGESYYVKSISSSEIRLYISRSLLSGTDYLKFKPNSNTTGTHTFTLDRHKRGILSPNSILRKFPLSNTISNIAGSDRGSENIGILIDGVEISSPKSSDTIYYGPLEKFEIFNGGKDYDVINPPQIQIATGVGGTALVEPVISGSVKQVFVDPQDFDVANVISLTLTGANGSGCSLEPIMGSRFREIEFDTRPISLGGGVDITDETITFIVPHGLVSGEHIIYNQNGNDPVSIGVAGDNTSTGTLVSGDEYVVRFVNTRTVKLFKNDSDAAAGINTIGLSTATSASGIHKFRTISKNTLRKIIVKNSGSGYQHRKLRVSASGISTEYDTIIYKNHGFESGDIVVYSTTGSVISGLSTTVQYSINKINSDSFKLINVGIGATVKTDLIRSKFVEINSTGTGYQIFQYPPVVVTAAVSFGSTITGSFTFTPIITGEIIDSYLYEKGVGYGSTILNLHNRPLVTVKNGKNAQLNPIISNGKIIEVQVLSFGSEYFSTPEIVAEDSGVGTGAILRPVISDGKIIDVVVINEGIGYNANTTTLYARPRGSNAIFAPSVRRLTVNDAERFGVHAKTRTQKIFSNLYENKTQDYLSYGIFGYSQDLAVNLNDNINAGHSIIIGWAYDGNPIYGPYGYTDPNNIQSGVSIINSGYKLDALSIFDRPSTSIFPQGFFIEDYKFDNSGNLDIHNGRFCKTPEFPNGVYAYFAGVTTSITSNTLELKYPYFVGETFRSKLISENLILNQKDFDFNNSNLVRNTFPYKISDPDADYDFIDEGYETFQQRSFITSVTRGSVENIDVIDGGVGYKIGEKINFNEEQSGGIGLRAEISELKGKNVTSIQTTLDQYNNSVFIRDSNMQVSAYYEFGFDLNNNDNVLVTGLSTSILNLYGTQKVGIITETVGLAATMSTYSATPGGIVEDIFVSSIPQISIGSSLFIKSSVGNETVRVLNNYNNGILRVKRFGTTGIAHTYGSEVNVKNNRIKIQVKTQDFTSSLNKLAYFNASQSVGFGTTSGAVISKTFSVGSISNTVSIPCRTIYIPNHPFKTGDRLTFTLPITDSLLVVGMSSSSADTFNLPNASTRTDTVFAINKGPDFIGLTTQVGLTTFTDGLFFHSGGSNSNEYFLKSNPIQVTGNIDRLVTLVSTASTHGLTNGDFITLNVEPNTIVGVGTTSALTLRLNQNDKKLLINPVGINSTSINTTTNTITISNHGFKTGDKIYYESSQVASGLSTGSYYVIEDSRDTFRLSETLYESNPITEKSVNIVGTGDTIHTFARINPKIDVVRNSNIKFNLNDPSLLGYSFKIFYDKDFKNEFITTYDSTNFNVVGLGSIGIGTASLTINYSKNIPNKLYYTLEKSGYISTSDTEVPNYSEINYVDSEYNGTYKIFGISSSSFKISPNKFPSVLSYNEATQTDSIEYTTTSASALNGSIGKIKILSSGFNFKKLPTFTTIDSTDGVNANVVALSTSIGRIKTVRIENLGFAYLPDKTLRPEIALPTRVGIDNSDVIDKFVIKSGGLKYLNAPDILLQNTINNLIVDSTSLIAITPNGAISEVKQLGPIFGLQSAPHRIVAINNSNGVGISSMTTSNSGVATCTITTPILGLTAALFENGDYIFVEGVELSSPTGSGYNSENYNYTFFRVDEFINSNPAILKFSLVDENGVGLTTNPGIAKTSQSGYATIINKKNYPDITVVQKRAFFEENEQLYVDNGTGFFSVDLRVSLVRNDYIKVIGKYKLQIGDKIKGKVTSALAEVTSINKDRAKFKISYSSKQDLGWRNDIGKLNEDYQVIPNNDYYQNLSYSIKSPIPWETLSSPVNSILHPAGMKNFADVGITSSVGISPMIGVSTSIVILDVFSEKRVDTINYFDNSLDIDVRGSQSKFLKLQNTKLSDYTECKTNRVLIHDDISGKFSSTGFQGLEIEIEEIDVADTHIRYLIQIVDPDSFDTQISEFILQTSSLNSTLFEKYSTYTNQKLGDFSANVAPAPDGTKTLIFTPTDPYDTDLDIKVLKRQYLNSFAGIGSISIGSINLISSNILGIGSVGTDTSEKSVYEFSSSNFNGAFATFEIVDRFGADVNVIEAVIDFDGTNTYISEYYFDAATISYSASNVGIITAIYDSAAGIVTVKIKGTGITTTSVYDVRSNIVEFANISSGIGTYRFLQSGQPSETESSVRLESVIVSSVGIVTIGSYDTNTISAVSSLVRVSVGSTSAIHQVSAMYDRQAVTVVPGPFTASKGATGLGTFGGRISGSKFCVEFYPDSPNIQAQAFNEVFYTESDFDNSPLRLTYGSNNQQVFLSAFNSFNGPRANRIDFQLTHEGTPIYQKTFNPSDATILNPTTGIFTINNHFYNTGEELIYTPDSTFVGVGKTAMGIGSTANYLGIVTSKLPERVYPIVLSPTTFKLSTQVEFANLGIGVTFTDVGVGNAHRLDFTKKLSKTVIAIDGIVQQPVTFTPISHTLQYNEFYTVGGISAGISTFNISGISSIKLQDLLKIDDEYMRVVEVGLSTNVDGQLLGPITGIINSGLAATFPTVSVIRGSVGSAKTTHSNGSNVQIFRGSFDIVGTKVFFTDPPRGSARTRRDNSNLPFPKASFSGRTFLRSNYSTNMIFDDISDQFTGIGKTFTLKSGGINTTGVTIGNGIAFINGVFQTPSTLNNIGNNYEFSVPSSGISSVVFSGITSTDGTFIQSEFDINQNQIPRGGLIVSLGSTFGLGYAPLVGAKVLAEKNSSGAITNIIGIDTYKSPVSISTALYNKVTGILELETSSPHNLVGGDRVQLVGLHFTCTPAYSGITTTIFPDHDRSFDITNITSTNKLNVQVGISTITHHYVGFGSIFKHHTLNFGSGYREPVSIGITDVAGGAGTGAVISATVGVGGSLSFTINSAGSGYTNPLVIVPEPVYENMSVVGVSRLGIGATTITGQNLLLNLKIGPAQASIGVGSTLSGVIIAGNTEVDRRKPTQVKQYESLSIVGTGSTLFLVESFEVARSGYNFQIGDVMKVVGLVTAKDYAEPISEFQLEVIETYNDVFSGWSFGEMDYLDSIRLLQNGTRTRFPLLYNGDLLSFEVDANSLLGSEIDLNSILLIFINGVLQTPGVSYSFQGGTSFIFTEAPDPEDKVDIFFYIGQIGVDVTVTNINESVKIGDELFVRRHPSYTTTYDQSRDRTIVHIIASDTTETDIYTGGGIDDVVFRPIDWTKQKSDKFIKGDIVFKTRDSLEPRIYPTTKIIGDIATSSTEIFVDNALFFNHEELQYGINISSVDGLIVDGFDPVSAAFTATVGTGGTISAVTTTNVGLGYSITPVPIKFTAPPIVGVGIGSTAIAEANIVGGVVSSITIVNPGFGYSTINPPQVIIEIPKPKTELISNITNVQGFAGIITGITTTTGVGGHPLALRINFRALASDANDLQVGYPILVYDTTVGTGVTSVNSGNSSVVGIGTQFLDNVYIVNSKTNNGPNAEILCNIHTNSSVVGIATTGFAVPIGVGIANTIVSLGNISWGRLYNPSEGLGRTNPISIGVTGLTVDSGLSTFPTIQRRKFGFRESGALRKVSSISDISDSQTGGGISLDSEILNN
jgi:hypothetical protein